MTRYNPNTPQEHKTMELIFSDSPMPTDVTKSIFLAGPSPRYKEGDIIRREWRHDAIDELKRQGYDGSVFIPLEKDWFESVGSAVDFDKFNYDSQIQWEDAAMSRADVILFWIPRTKEMMGLTTNIEFGRYLESGRLVVGYPENAFNCGYIGQQLDKRNMPHYDHLRDCTSAAITRMGDGAYREGDQVLVPLVIWKSDQFQTWYNNTICEQGNRLDGFNVKSIIAFNDFTQLFGFAAHVSIWLTREDRHKSNEWIFSRTSTSYVAPYYLDESGVHHFVLVREFRSPANNRHGYVFELPGGSSSEKCDVIVNAQKELHEETGLEVTDLSRFKVLGNRQTFSTFSTNQIVACGLQLTLEEYNQLKQDAENKVQFGENDGERITLYTATLKELLDDESEVCVDYTTLGIILLAVNK